jgi:lactoylglutathione lyase
MRHIAFVLDPDGYWVEVIGQKPLEETENVEETDTATYRMVGLISPEQADLY